MYDSKMINDLLIKYDCIMAHCFTLENAHGSIYERIDHCISRSHEYELCTSTIHHGDIAFTNYYGGIGVVIKSPKIIFSSPSDGATFRGNNGELFFDDEIGTENPSVDKIEFAIKSRVRYNEFRVLKYIPIGLFISRDDEGWHYATETIKSDLMTFHERTKDYNLPYFYLKDGQLSLIEFDEKTKRFNRIHPMYPKDLYL